MSLEKRAFRIRPRTIEAGVDKMAKDELNRVLQDMGQKTEEALAHLSAGNVDTPTKGKANGLADLNASTRLPRGVDTTDDVVIDLPEKGVVLKAQNGRYWRLTIDDTGAIVTTDVGPRKP